MRFFFTFLILSFFSLKVYCQEFSINEISGVIFDPDQPEVKINTTFDLHGMVVHPQDLTLKYNSVTSQFKFFGAAEIDIEGDIITISLGNESNPGILVENEQLKHVNIGITEEFEMKGLSIFSKNLTLEWTGEEDSCKIYGEAEINLENDTIIAELGTSTKPGITIVNGEIQEININITEDFEINDLTLQAKNAGILWVNESNSSQNTVKSLEFNGESSYVQFPNADHFYRNDFTISFWINPVYYNELKDVISKAESTFHIFFRPGGTLHFAVKDNEYHEIQTSNPLPLNEWTHVTCIFSASQGRFEIWLNGFKNASGDPSTIGTLFNNGHELTIGKLATWSSERFFHGQLRNVCYWGCAMGAPDVYGYQYIMPDENDPNCIGAWPMDDAEGGVIRDVSQFNNSGTLHNTSWKTEIIEEGESGKTFNFYGDFTMIIAGKDTINIDCGTDEHPGIIISDGTLEKIDITTDDVFTLGNLEVDAEGIHFTYNHDNEEYDVRGVLKVTDIWDAILELGEGGEKGLVIDCSGAHPEFKLENFSIEIDNVTLGSIELKKLLVEFENEKIKDADLKVLFPPAWEVEGKMGFVDNSGNLEVEYVSVDWQATKLDDAIEIGATGIFLVEMSGGLNHLDNLDNIEFTGDVVLTYGGPFNYNNKELALVEMSDNIFISKNELKLGADVNLGAYKENETWGNYLGEGKLSVDLKWHHYYKLHGNVTMPADKMVEFDLLAYLSSEKNIDILAEMDFYVPEFVPFIGGDKLAGVDGAVRYLNNYPNSSYAAAWYTVGLPIFGHATKGAKYNIGTGHLGIIGGDDVDDIKTEIHKDVSALKSTSSTKNENNVLITNTFEITENSATMFWVDINWGKILDTATIQINGPEGITHNIPIYSDKTSDTLLPEIYTGEELNIIINDSAINLLVYYPTDSNEIDNHIAAPPGEYTVVLGYKENETVVDSVSVQVNKHYPSGNGTISYNMNDDGEIQLNMEYTAYFPDSCLITPYISFDSSYIGSPIVHLPFEKDANSPRKGSSTIYYRPNVYTENQDYFFYLVVDDGKDKPYYSNIIKVSDYTPPVCGRIVNADGNIAGFKLFIDKNRNGINDKTFDGTYETASISSDSGYFFFNETDFSDTLYIDLALPYNYELIDDENTLPWKLTPSSTILNKDIYIRKKNL